MKIIMTALAAMAVAGPALAQQAHTVAVAPSADQSISATTQGTGTVKKLNPKAGTVTLQHGPIASLGWPAMTMDFKIDPALLKDIKVGQHVSFNLKTSGAAEVVAIKPK